MMSDLLLQFIGLLLLIGGLWGGFGRWIGPRRGSLDREQEGLLFLMVATCIGGVFGSVFWWLDLRQSFAWDLPTLASRMLGAAAVGFGVIGFLALEKPTYGRVRLVLIALAVYLLPLAVAIGLFHTDRFEFEKAITYGFFGIALPMGVGAAWYLVRQPSVFEEPEALPVSGERRWWLMGMAVVMAVWGVGLFVTDEGFLDEIWVWPSDLLTSRLIGVMLLTIAAGAVYSMGDGDVAGVMLWMMVTYGAGVVVANGWNAAVGLPMKGVYMVGFGMVGVISLWLLRENFRAKRKI